MSKSSKKSTSSKTSVKPVYRRVLLKISGEALMGNQPYGQDQKTIERICRDIKSAIEIGVELCLVVGGGNIFRGMEGANNGMERASADYMGMLATVLNALAIQNTNRTFAAAPCAIWSAAASLFSPLAPATRISPPTRRLRCAPTKWAVISS